jgi:hypothetical protein
MTGHAEATGRHSRAIRYRKCYAVRRIARPAKMRMHAPMKPAIK